MIGFATSFRAKALARDWAAHVWLLERTLTSMLAVEHSTVVVGCHEAPVTPLAANPRITFLPVDAPIPRRTNDDMCIDKVIKVSAAIRLLQDRGTPYVAVCDADDLVSRRIGPFVAARAGAPGWFTPVSLVFAYGRRWMRRLALPPDTTGAFAIIRADLLSSAVPPFSGAWVDQLRREGEDAYVAALAARRLPVCPLIAAGHGNYARLLAAAGHRLEPLPFPAYLQINHADSVSSVQGGSGTFARPSFGAILRSAHHWLPTLRPLPRRVRQEFAILDRIPPSYAGASLFWR